MSTFGEGRFPLNSSWWYRAPRVATRFLSPWIAFGNPNGLSRAIWSDWFGFADFPGYTSGKRLAKRKRHAAPLKRRAYGNVAATIPVVAPHSQAPRPNKKRRKHLAPLRKRASGNVPAIISTAHGYARLRIQKARRKRYRPARHLTPSPFIPVVPPPVPVGGHYYPQGWIKRHEKPDTAKEIRDLIDEIVYGKPTLEEVVEAVSVPVLVREVEQRLVIPQIDVAGVVREIMAVLAEHQRIQDEMDDDDSFMLMGDL